MTRRYSPWLLPAALGLLAACSDEGHEARGAIDPPLTGNAFEDNEFHFAGVASGIGPRADVPVGSSEHAAATDILLSPPPEAPTTWQLLTDDISLGEFVTDVSTQRARPGSGR